MLGNLRDERTSFKQSDGSERDGTASGSIMRCLFPHELYCNCGREHVYIVVIVSQKCQVVSKKQMIFMDSGLIHVLEADIKGEW